MTWAAHSCCPAEVARVVLRSLCVGNMSAGPQPWQVFWLQILAIFGRCACVNFKLLLNVKTAMPTAPRPTTEAQGNTQPPSHNISIGSPPAPFERNSCNWINDPGNIGQEHIAACTYTSYTRYIEIMLLVQHHRRRVTVSTRTHAAGGICMQQKAVVKSHWHQPAVIATSWCSTVIM